MNRRQFIRGAGLFLAAPAIVTAGNIMPVRPVRWWGLDLASGPDQTVLSVELIQRVMKEVLERNTPVMQEIVMEATMFGRAVAETSLGADGFPLTKRVAPEEFEYQGVRFVKMESAPPDYFMLQAHRNEPD